jgi:hypothetical protein
MKKFIALLCMTALVSGAIIAQEIRISGEAKTGLYWEQKQREGKEKSTDVKMHNNDDAGSNQGRFRLNVDLKKDNFGFMFRINQEDMTAKELANFPYAFGYVNLFQDQFKVSIGKLGGGSPWATGGPEMWEELETSVGARFEYKPSFVHGLNVGFVVNNINNLYSQTGIEAKATDYLQETVLGARYDHEWFGVRFAYRLDSPLDQKDSNDEGQSMIYRVEEKVLQKYLPGFQIWMNGHYTGINAEVDNLVNYLNWLYVQYAAKNFTAQFRVGLDVVENRNILHLRPSFYYNFFNNLLNVGMAFYFAQDFGDGKMWDGSPYLYMRVEPKVQVNLGPAYIAYVYHFEDAYNYNTAPARERINWWNLRFGYSFSL